MPLFLVKFADGTRTVVEGKKAYEAFEKVEGMGKVVKSIILIAPCPKCGSTEFKAYTGREVVGMEELPELINATYVDKIICNKCCFVIWER